MTDEEQKLIDELKGNYDTPDERLAEIKRILDDGHRQRVERLHALQKEMLPLLIDRSEDIEVEMMLLLKEALRIDGQIRGRPSNSTKYVAFNVLQNLFYDIDDGYFSA